ncbi:MAG: DUF4249 domain-containing protein [Bacteroidales bacterium]|nr:DUF4249 domain-containing protein [Bacteroidales bacterium]
MINKVKNLIAISVVVIFTFSCTERIDINLDQQKYARLVVEGEFSSDTMTHKVVLTRTEDYFSNTIPGRVSNAQISISSIDEEYELSETPENSGVYLTDSLVAGTIGKEYTLRILLDEEIGGASEYTAQSKINPISELDSIALEFHQDWGKEGFWEVKCYVLDPPTEDYYMFHIYRNGVLINDTIEQVFVVDDLLYNGNYTNGIGVGFLDQSKENQKLIPGDKVSLRVARITKEYTNFLWQLQEEISFQTPLFSGPPANVEGNISNGAFGAFGAYSTSYASKIVIPPTE